MSGFWDGTFTDYGTAVGTVGLAAITTISVIREASDRKVLKAERDQAQARAAELEQAEATGSGSGPPHVCGRVTCFMDTTPYEPGVVTIMSGDGGVPIDGGLMECAVVRNMSDKPISRVEIYWQNALGNGPVGEVSVIRPALIAVVPPLGIRTVRKPSTLDGFQRSQLALLVKFDDTNGVRWGRRDSGALYEA